LFPWNVTFSCCLLQRLFPNQVRINQVHEYMSSSNASPSNNSSSNTQARIAHLLSLRSNAKAPGTIDRETLLAKMKQRMQEKNNSLSTKTSSEEQHRAELRKRMLERQKAHQKASETNTSGSKASMNLDGRRSIRIINLNP